MDLAIRVFDKNNFLFAQSKSTGKMLGQPYRQRQHRMGRI